MCWPASQIGKFFHGQGHDEAVPGIAEHIRKFWDPRMRDAILSRRATRGSIPRSWMLSGR
jgi:formate dehydrogenase subunit delta